MSRTTVAPSPSSGSSTVYLASNYERGSGLEFNNSDTSSENLQFNGYQQQLRSGGPFHGPSTTTAAAPAGQPSLEDFLALKRAIEENRGELSALRSENSHLRKAVASVTNVGGSQSPQKSSTVPAVTPNENLSSNTEMSKILEENRLLKQQMVELQLEMRRMKHRSKHADETRRAASDKAIVSHGDQGEHQQAHPQQQQQQQQQQQPQQQSQRAAVVVTSQEVALAQAQGQVLALVSDNAALQSALDRVSNERMELLHLVNELNTNYEALERARAADSGRLAVQEAVIADRDGELKILKEWKTQAENLRDELAKSTDAEKKAVYESTMQLFQMADEQETIRQLTKSNVSQGATLAQLTGQLQQLAAMADMEASGRMDLARRLDAALGTIAGLTAQVGDLSSQLARAQRKERDSKRRLRELTLGPSGGGSSSSATTEAGGGPPPPPSAAAAEGSQASESSPVTNLDGSRSGSGRGGSRRRSSSHMDTNGGGHRRTRRTSSGSGTRRRRRVRRAASVKDDSYSSYDYDESSEGDEGRGSLSYYSDDDTYGDYGGVDVVGGPNLSFGGGGPMSFYPPPPLPSQQHMHQPQQPQQPMGFGAMSAGGPMFMGNPPMMMPMDGRSQHY